MKFEIEKTSQYSFNKNKKPCKHALIGARSNTKYGDKNFWYVEINTLEELMSLKKEVKEELIISDPIRYSNTDGYIEIYDDYRE